MSFVLKKLRRRPYVVRALRFWDPPRGFVRRAKVRSASLTARECGKISRSPESINTTLVPSAYRAAVTPRVALEKSYSGRMVSSPVRWVDGLFLFFFIVFAFSARRLTGTDDAGVFVDLSVANNQKPLSVAGRYAVQAATQMAPAQTSAQSGNPGDSERIFTLSRETREAYVEVWTCVARGSMAAMIWCSASSSP